MNRPQIDYPQLRIILIVNLLFCALNVLRHVIILTDGDELSQLTNLHNAEQWHFKGGEEGGIAPTFIEKPKITPNATGTIITMRCRCRANPKPEVTWYRGTTKVSVSSRIKMKIVDVEEDVYDLFLEIQVITGLTGI